MVDESMDAEKLVEQYLAAGLDFGYEIHMMALAGRSNLYEGLYTSLVDLERCYVALGYRAVPLQQFELAMFPAQFSERRIPLEQLVGIKLAPGEKPAYPAAEYRGEPFIQ